MRTKLLLLLVVGALSGACHAQDTPQEGDDVSRAAVMKLWFTDFYGNLREIMIPQHHAKEVVEQGAFFDGSSIPGYASIHESDMWLKPDTKTFGVVQDFLGVGQTGFMLADVYQDEVTPYPADPRGVLKRSLAKAESNNLDFCVGVELELFLFNDTSRDPQQMYQLVDTRGYCDAMVSLPLQRKLQFILAGLTTAGIDVQKMHHEVAQGQMEIVLRHGSALQIADHLVIAKHLIHLLCSHVGLRATFMPKVFADQNGSGMHIHYSLRDKTTGENLFADAEGQYHLSPLAQSFIAGNLRHIRAFDILCNSTVNSFKRLVAGFEAPVYVCWSFKNRSAMIRIPQINNAQMMSSVRAEIRCPDGLCNPYLAFAAILESGLKGVREQEPLPEPVEENLAHISPEALQQRGVGLLPASLDEALEEFSTAACTTECLGAEFVNCYTALKQRELRRFHEQAARVAGHEDMYGRTVISAWEKSEYF